MHDWKVIQLLNHMGLEQLKQFEKWLKEVLKGKETQVWHLFQILKNKPTDKLIIDSIKKALVKKGASPNKLRGYASSLSRRIEDFLLENAIQEDKVRRELYLLKFYHDKNLQSLFDRSYKQLRPQLEKQALYTGKAYQHLYELEVLRHNIQIKNQDPHKFNSLAEINKRLDQEWTLRKLELACANRSFQQIIGQESPSFLLDPMIEQLPALPYWSECSLHQVYREIYLFFTHKKPAHLFQLLEKVMPSTSKDVQEEGKVIYQLMMNLFIQEYNSRGEISVGKMLLELYSIGVKKKLLYNQEKLSWRHYKNLITVALKIGEHEQAKEVMNRYQAELSTKEKDEVLRFCKGLYHFYTGNFREAKSAWKQEKFPQIFFEIQAKIHLWEIAYEESAKPHADPRERDYLIGNLEQLLSYLEGLKGISLQQRQPYLNRIHLYQLLFQKEDMAGLAEIENKAANMYPFNSREWLLKMVEKRKG